MYLVKIHDRFPELILHLVEVSHSDFPEVTRVVLVEVGAVVVLSTSHTATTGVLPVLADTSMAGGDVAAAVMVGCQWNWPLSDARGLQRPIGNHREGGGDILFPRLCRSSRHRGGVGFAVRLSWTGLVGNFDVGLLRRRCARASGLSETWHIRPHVT